MNKKVADASFLISAIRSCDVNHWGCYDFLKKHEDDDWIIPAIAYFEYQAAQSALARAEKGGYRQLFLPEHWRIYGVTLDFIEKCGLDMVELFPNLKGADLIYACIARVENASLVTCDFDFDACSVHIDVLNPLRENASWWRGEVTKEREGVKYVGQYKVTGSVPMLTLVSGSASVSTHLGGSAPKSLARILLSELAQAGRAKRAS